MSMKTEVESLRHDVEDEREEFKRLTAGLRTRAQLSRTAVEAVLFIVLAVGSGLLFWGSSFAHGMVHDQLAAQHISFPAKGSAAIHPKEFPGLQRYAGHSRQVTSVAFAADGTSVFTASASDSTVRRWLKDPPPDPWAAPADMDRLMRELASDLSYLSINSATVR